MSISDTFSRWRFSPLRVSLPPLRCSRRGYIKRMRADTFGVQKRGGKGALGRDPSRPGSARPWTLPAGVWAFEVAV